MEKVERHSPDNALIVVDVQVDFCPGGSLAVAGGDKVAERIHRFVEEHGDEYKIVVATKDWHPSPDDILARPSLAAFDHFSINPDFVDTWPVHCVHETSGAEFHPNLRATSPNDQPWPPGEGMIEFDVTFYKGQSQASYSGFDGVTYPPGYHTTKDPAFGWTLDAYLTDKRIGHVDIVGLALDYCVKATAIDAAALGYDTTVFLDMTEAVDQNERDINANLAELEMARVHLDEWDG